MKHNFMRLVDRSVY